MIELIDGWIRQNRPDARRCAESRLFRETFNIIRYPYDRQHIRSIAQHVGQKYIAALYEVISGKTGSLSRHITDLTAIGRIVRTTSRNTSDAAFRIFNNTKDC